MASITVNGNTIDPEAAHNVSAHSRNSNFILIQGRHVLSVAEKQALEKKGVLIQEYVAEYTYLCRYEPSDLQPLRSLPFVRTVNVKSVWVVYARHGVLKDLWYNAQLKTTISLKDMVQRQTDKTHYEVDLILHNAPNETSTALASSVAEAAGVDVDDLEILPRKIRLTVDQDRIANLAAIDSINRIEEVRSKGLYNDQARAILHLEPMTGSISTTYQGTAQVVCVADSGFDQGISTDTDSVKVHPAFAGRIERILSIWSNTDPHDPIGHGTHVCASVCGSGIYKATPESKGIVVQGTAPGAKLMVQSMSKLSSDKSRWVLKIPADASRLFSGAYDVGVRIHTNSWGNVWDSHTGQLGYEADATAIDTFVCQHPDFIVMVAAGNDAREHNHGASQIGDNGSAKNCITVGATGTTRSNDGQRYEADLPAISKVTDTAIFSSRGPTKSTLDSKGQTVSGRIKPDVVAPGVAILSAASRAVAANAPVRVEFGPSSDPDWMFASGTSTSTPLVAGCVAVLREALQKVGKQHPSAALIKALLINGAVSHSGSTNPVFDYQQGFGRVNVNASIAMIEQTSFVDGGNKLDGDSPDVPPLRVVQETDKIWQSPALNIPSDSHRLVVTLTYPDPPGALLQNDVNLIVRAGDVERHGNMGSDNGFDHTNNMEKIIWDNIPGTTATIIVRADAFTVPTSEQSFAVAWDIRSI